MLPENIVFVTRRESSSPACLFHFIASTNCHSGPTHHHFLPKKAARDFMPFLSTFSRRFWASDCFAGAAAAPAEASVFDLCDGHATRSV